MTGRLDYALSEVLKVCCVGFANIEIHCGTGSALGSPFVFVSIFI